MDRDGCQSQSGYGDAQVASVEQYESVNFDSTEDDQLLSKNRYQTTTESSVTGTEQSSSEDYINFLIEREPFSRPVMETRYGHTYHVQMNGDPFQPVHGVSFGIAGHYPLSIHEPFNLQPVPFPCQIGGIPIGSETTQLSQYLHMHNSDLETGNFGDLMQRPSDVLGNLTTHTPFTGNNGLGHGVLFSEVDFLPRPPWSAVFPRETEIPLLTATQDDPGLPPPPGDWKLKQLVTDLHSPNHHAAFIPSKSPTTSEFAFVSTPFFRSSDDSHGQQRTQNNLSSNNSPRSGRLAWNVETGYVIPERPKRNSTRSARNNSMAIRHLGGQCPKCKRGKRKCHPSHIRGASHSSATSSPPRTPPSSGSPPVKASIHKRQRTRLTGPSAQRHGDHLLPPHAAHRRPAVPRPRQQSAGPGSISEETMAVCEHEGSALQARSATGGSPGTSMLNLNAGVDLIGSATFLSKADSSAPNIGDFGNIPLSDAYMGVGGQFECAPSEALRRQSCQGMLLNSQSGRTK